MKKTLLLTALIILSIICYPQKIIHCLIKTSLGDISIKLYPKNAPLTVQNFMRYADNKLYDSSSFFRVCTPANEAARKIKIEVIQGGNVSEEKLFPPIALETTQQTKLLHKNGTISMARGTPDSAQSDFFICIGNQPALDYNGNRNPDGQGFAAFGMVTGGMDVVRKIQLQKDTNQYLIKPVTIYTILRIN